VEVLELYVYTLRHAAVHCLGDSRDRREGNGAQGDDSMRLLKELRPEGSPRRRGEGGVLYASHLSESLAIMLERDHLGRTTGATAFYHITFLPRHSPMTSDSCLHALCIQELCIFPLLDAQAVTLPPQHSPPVRT
jgi:hypothetical protein